MLDFQFIEDRNFFEGLFESVGGVDQFQDLFDFNDPLMKRHAFNAIRNQVFKGLVAKYGDKCMLNYHDDCSGKAEQVDHLIPLSSNILNKTLRHMKGQAGKKVPAQPFGSNSEANFVLACARCNAAKKHHLPDKKLLEAILIGSDQSL